ncbi:hypothetical protein HDU67_009781 [Dinochytrium kinnereticum]|nr:hypothetical protein HDU67_009781 [Dinochytrium kinnereticum]
MALPYISGEDMLLRLVCEPSEKRPPLVAGLKLKNTLSRFWNNVKSSLRPSKNFLPLRYATENAKAISRSAKVFRHSADKAIEDFNIHRLLGGGISGQVFLAQEKASKMFVALKLIRKDGKRGDETSQALKYESIYKELEVFKAASGCPHLLQLHWAFESFTAVYFVTELAAMSLKDFSDRFGMVPREINFCAQEIILGLKFLHGKKIMHRDIKPDNVLVFFGDYTEVEQPQLKRLKLADFGLASESANASVGCGTEPFMAPEVIKKKPSLFASDYWSLGVTLFWLKEKDYPFGDTEEEVLERTKEPRGCAFLALHERDNSDEDDDDDDSTDSGTDDSSNASDAEDEGSEDDEPCTTSLVDPLKEEIVFQTFVNKLLTNNVAERQDFVDHHMLSDPYFEGVDWEKPRKAFRMYRPPKEIPEPEPIEISSPPASRWKKFIGHVSKIISSASKFFFGESDCLLHDGELIPEQCAILPDVLESDVPENDRIRETPIFAAMPDHPRPTSFGWFSRLLSCFRWR